MSKKLVFYLEGSDTLIFCQSPLTCCVLQLDWCDLSLSIFVRREMLWVPWRRCAVSWPTTWAHTPSGDGRGCWRGSHSPGEKAELTSREEVSDLGSEGICCLTFLNTTRGFFFQCSFSASIFVSPWLVSFIRVVTTVQNLVVIKKIKKKVTFVILKVDISVVNTHFFF